MAVKEKIAFAAIGDARSSRPGRMATMVLRAIARRGVPVMVELWPKNPQSGNP